MADPLIEGIIDNHLNMLIEPGLNIAYTDIEPEMLTSTHENGDAKKFWLPIPSKVTDEEILAFEARLGHKLPTDYIAFLKYKHFYELSISEASFCAHPVNTWQASLSRMIFEGHSRKYLLDRALIPFANWSDWGLLCFDVNRNFFTARYPIVLWDHETPDWHEDFCISFRSLIKKLDADDKKSRAEE
jgi:hypothetical protein